MKVLVLGYGLFGKEVIKHSGWDYICRKNSEIDFRNPKSYEDYIKQYDIVLNAIGYTNTWGNEKEPSWSINYVGVMDLVDMCNKYSKKLIHISTDYIYANSCSFATETDIPIHFDNWYTYSKLLADAYVQARSEDYLLIRASFKPRPYPWDVAWSDLQGNFDYIDVIVSKTIALIKKEASGVFNVGTETKTMHDLAVKTRKRCMNIEHAFIPFDITMNTNKLDDLLSDYDI